MKELLEIYKLIDVNLNKNKSSKKIEEILNNTQIFINMSEKDKQHILNYTNKQNTEMKRITKTEINTKVQKKSKNTVKNDETDKIDKIDKTDELTGEQLSSQTKAVILSKITDEEYNKRKKIYDDLEKIVLPEQRSKEWFEMRDGKMTASDGGCAAGQNKYEAQYKFVHKKVYGSTFKTNQACYHGKKLEEPVTLMYEYQNDVKVKEFGLLGHAEYNYLGASPDGICCPYKRNGKSKSDLVGRMLEIKCPLFRKIKYKGDVVDVICPIYYWCQVQLQLECCDLDECDFVQCNIEEYNTRQEWLDDASEECDYISKKYGKEKGVLVEFIPTNLFTEKKEKEKKYEDDSDEEEDEQVNNDEEYGEGYDADEKIKLNRIYDMTTFKYQPKIDMTNKQIDKWIEKTTKGYKNIYDVRKEQLNGTFNAKKEKDIAVHKIIYWRLKERNCTLVKRDRKWFGNIIPTYKQMWEYVTIFRNDKIKRKKWQKYVKLKEDQHNARQFNNYYAKNMAEKEIGDVIFEEMKKIINE
jgi:putative phage-type endonuclease